MTAKAQQDKESMKIVIVGHVDHGKSSLIGRLFHDTKSLPEGKYESIKLMCEKRGMPFEWAFLMDALQSERDQGITIDTSQIWFSTKKRDYIIIDAPGHKEFLKNMISGAANSEVALLIIDAKEGVQEQSKKHGYLLHLLGITQIAVVVNKMDLVDYSEKAFKDIEREYTAYLKGLNITPNYIIPISAREGDFVAKRSKHMSWFKGPTILEALDLFNKKPNLDALPLRFPVQDIYKFDERRIIAGRIESGTIKIGDEILFSPSNKSTKISSIEYWHGKMPLTEATAGMSVGITMAEQIFAERGNVISHHDEPPILTNVFRAKLFWLGNNSLTYDKQYKIKVNTSEFICTVKEIESVVDTEDLSNTSGATEVTRNSVAEVILQIRGMIAIDEFKDNEKTGRFVLIEDYDIVGGGIIDMHGLENQRVERKVKSENLIPVEYNITYKDREQINGHKSGILWFTGLSGSGKTTLSKIVQKQLFDKGYQVYILDGDNIRTGINSDLGFSHKDRKENIRRIAEIAKLLADSGCIVIASLIAPYSEDRHIARAIAPNFFNSVYIKASLEICEKRDPKGLYHKARKGEIKHFTGIDDKYDIPDNPDLVIDTEKHSVEACTDRIMQYIDKNFSLKQKANVIEYDI